MKLQRDYDAGRGEKRRRKRKNDTNKEKSAHKTVTPLLSDRWEDVH